MLFRKINAAPAKINAFTLIEMLLTLALGSVILLSISQLFSYFQTTHKTQQTLMQLQKESHQLLHYLQQHIQHIGYQGASRKESNFSLFEKAGKRYAQPSPNCLIFFYDVNNDGCLGKRQTKTTACRIASLNQTKDLAKEIFGFKLENKELLIYTGNTLENCSEIQCQKLLSQCHTGRWEKLISKEDFQIDKLNLQLKDNIMQIELIISKENIAYENKALVFILNSEAI